MADTRVTEGSFDLPGFQGELIHPGTPAYDEARAVFNGMIDRRPGLIARCAGPDDVAAAVRIARDHDLPLSVYGGGHGVTGSAVCDAGVCVDLRGMKGITVDPAAKTVRAEAGLTWGELDAATQEHGLAVTGGRVSSTGIAGLTLGSGSGWLERSFGFVCDNLVKAEVVTADGEQVIASEDENPDLFWGLRGGGGNFGIVTAFHLRLHDLGPIVFGGMLMYPAAMGGELLRFYRDFMTNAPDEVCSGLAFITAPPEEFVPEPVRGQPVIGVVCCVHRPGRRRSGRVPGFCASSGRPASTCSARSRTSRCSSSSTAARRRACRTTGPRTSWPSCPTRPSTCSSSTRPRPSRRSRK